MVEGARIQAVTIGTPQGNRVGADLHFMTAADGPNVNATSKLIVRSTGLISLANSAGIDFSGIQNNNAGMTSETLDSYEEGTFTPRWSWVGDNGNVAANQGAGFYTKIGNQVYFSIRFNNTGSGANYANAISIIGMPFPARTSACSNPFSFYFVTLPDDIASVEGKVNQNATTTQIQAKQVSGDFTSLTPAMIGLDGGTNRNIEVAGFYSVN